MRVKQVIYGGCDAQKNRNNNRWPEHCDVTVKLTFDLCFVTSPLTSDHQNLTISSVRPNFLKAFL